MNWQMENFSHCLSITLPFKRVNKCKVFVLFYLRILPCPQMHYFLLALKETRLDRSFQEPFLLLMDMALLV